MYDGGKVLVGLFLFVVLIGFPLWYTPIFGKAGPPPVIETPEEGQCVLPGDEMREEHMQILDDWRDEVVREGDRYLDRDLNDDGKPEEKSLTLTCLGCHGPKSQFCDKCHNYAGVDPFCWDCHIIPEENK